MAQQTINVGAAPNDGTGTPLRTAFQYTNSNFSELYTAVGPSGNNIVVPGNATLASATITGNLTVDTNTFFADSANDRVGVGTASPAVRFNIADSDNAANGTIRLGVGAIYSQIKMAASSTGATEFTNVGNGVNGAYNFSIDGQNQYKIATSGVFTWFDGAGGTRMTLNATGLAIGDTAFAGTRLTLRESASQPNALAMTNRNATQTWRIGVDVSAVDDKILGFYDSTSTTFRMQLTDTGNLGIGVTPSAWSGIGPVIEMPYGSISGYLTGFMYIAQNAFWQSAWKYKNTAAASYYGQQTGQHQWWNAPSGTAGNAITFTQAMTLDASGNLLVGTTAPLAGNAAKFHLSTNSGTTRWAVGPYSDPNSFIISAVGGSGVYLNGTAATSWTSASDERLKDIIEPISNAVAKVGSLRAVIGKFKFDQNNTRKPFLIAQDLQSVFPEAVDASNPDQLGVAYTDVIPLLVAAIKELTARVQTLETR